MLPTASWISPSQPTLISYRTRALVLSVLVVGVSIYLLVDRFPRTVEVENKASTTNWIPVSETSTSDDGTIREVITYRPEVKTVLITTIKEPTSKQKLQFYLTLAFSIFFGVYALIVLFLWSRHKIKGARKGTHSEDNEKRLDSLIKISTGIVLGFLASDNFIDPQMGAPQELQRSLPDDLEMAPSPGKLSKPDRPPSFY